MDAIVLTKKVTLKNFILSIYFHSNISSMKKLVFSLLLIAGVVEVGNAQTMLSGWEISTGLNWIDPKVVRENEPYATSPALGWQMGIGRSIMLTDIASIHLNGGFAQMNFDPATARNRNVSMSYAFMDASFKLEKAFSTFMPFGKFGLRGSTLLNDNLDEVFFLAFRESFDYGLSLSLGSVYQIGKINPFVEVSYYYGLLNITPNSIVDNSGRSFSDELRNQGYFVNIGIRFK